MTVLHVISGLGIGGAETMLVQLSTALSRIGWQQQVVSISSHNNHATQLRDNGIEVSILGVGSLLEAPAALFRLRNLIKAMQPSIVQGWMYHGDLFATLAHQSVASDHRRLLWNLRASNMDARRYARILRWNARLSRLPDVVIANSQAGADFHVANGYRPKRIEVIPNGVDTVKFHPDSFARADVRRELGIAEDAVVAIHVARVDPMKDHALFLKALAALPDLKGLLVGRGTELLTLPVNAVALGVRTDLRRLYAAADIVVSTSAFGEGFSNVVAEGMSAGLVPIATDVGDARSIALETGHIVPPGDGRALTEALSHVAGKSIAEREASGLKGREHIVERFSLEAAVLAYHDLYQQIAQSAAEPVEKVSSTTSI